MIENNSEKKIILYCKNCDQTTQIKQGGNFNNEQHSPFCEHCGDKLLVKEKITKPLHSNHEVSENLLYKNIFVDDKRFSKDFKGDLVSAISRIIYIKLKAAAFKVNSNISHINLKNKFKKELADYILSEITTKKLISHEYLSEQPNFQPNDFYHIYTQFQSALKSDDTYAEAFKQYLYWLIGNVYDISSGDRTRLTPFEQILKNEINNIDKNEEKFRKINRNISFSNSNNNITTISDKLTLNKIHSHPADPTLNKETVDKIEHYNKWLTDYIQNYIKNMDEEIKYLFEPYVDFSKMDALFGLSKGYIAKQRMRIKSEKVIAKSILDQMRYHFKQKIEKWINIHHTLTELLLNAQSDILDFINQYETVLNPKPTPDYQMYNHHPDFKRKYFSDIITAEQAYWLGFLFADGWIVIEHKKSRNYYRMGLQLSIKDKKILFKFCEDIGLNPKYIKNRDAGSAFNEKKYPMTEIRWGDQDFAQNLINLGMEYEYSEEKGRRVKTPRLPNLRSPKLMLAFLLGFYDGDGTRGYDKDTGRIRPRIASSDVEFLIQIKKYFKIEYQISSTEIEKYNIRTKKIVKISGSRLDIGVDLFEEMLRIYDKSFERKRVPLEFFNGYFEPKPKPPTPQRIWLRKNLPKLILDQMIKVLSPNLIAKTVGLHRDTIVNLAKEYGIQIFGAGHYISIDRIIHYNGKDSEFYKPFHYWLDHLKKLGIYRQ